MEPSPLLGVHTLSGGCALSEEGRSRSCPWPREEREWEVDISQGLWQREIMKPGPFLTLPFSSRWL